MRRLHEPKIPEQQTPILDESKLKKLISVCERDKSFTGPRDAAIIRVFADTGARLSEVANLTVDDLDLNADGITVMGKGRRPRTLGIGARTGAAIDSTSGRGSGISPRAVTGFGSDTKGR